MRCNTGSTAAAAAARNQVVRWRSHGNEPQERRWIISRQANVRGGRRRERPRENHSITNFIRSRTYTRRAKRVCVCVVLVEQCWKRNSALLFFSWRFCWFFSSLAQLFSRGSLLFSSITSIQYKLESRFFLPTFFFFLRVFFFLLLHLPPRVSGVSLRGLVSVYRWCSACEDVNVRVNQKKSVWDFFTWFFFSFSCAAPTTTLSGCIFQCVDYPCKTILETIKPAKILSSFKAVKQISLAREKKLCVKIFAAIQSNEAAAAAAFGHSSSARRPRFFSLAFVAWEFWMKTFVFAAAASRHRSIGIETEAKVASC